MTDLIDRFYEDNEEFLTRREEELNGKQGKDGKGYGFFNPVLGKALATEYFNTGNVFTPIGMTPKPRPPTPSDDDPSIYSQYHRIMGGGAD